MNFRKLSGLLTGFYDPWHLVACCITELPFLICTFGQRIFRDVTNLLSHLWLFHPGDLFEKAEDIEDPRIWREVAGSEDPHLQAKNRQMMLHMADYIIPGHGPMFKVTDAMRERHLGLLNVVVDELDWSHVTASHYLVIVLRNFSFITFILDGSRQSEKVGLVFSCHHPTFYFYINQCICSTQALSKLCIVVKQVCSENLNSWVLYFTNLFIKLLLKSVAFVWLLTQLLLPG